MTTRRPLERPAEPPARYSATERARFASGSATIQLHHVLGHDPYLRPYAFNGRQDFTFYPGPRLPDPAFPDLKNKSFTLTASIEIPDSGAEGVLATQGGRFGGWGLLVYKSAPAFIYKFFNFPGQMLRIDSPHPLAPGKHVVSVDFTYDGGGLGKGGIFVLKADGVEVARGRIEHTVPGWFPQEGVGIGHDTGTPIAEDYKIPFKFTGTLERLDVHLATPAGMPPPGVD